MACTNTYNPNMTLSTTDIQELGNCMSFCESYCLDQSSCNTYSLLEQRYRLLDGQAGECKCCGEIYNFEDMKNGYCDRCQRAVESRC